MKNITIEEGAWDKKIRDCVYDNGLLPNEQLVFLLKIFEDALVEQNKKCRHRIKAIVEGIPCEKYGGGVKGTEDYIKGFNDACEEVSNYKQQIIGRINGNN